MIRCERGGIDPIGGTPHGGARAEGKGEVIAFLRMVLYRCCMAIAFMCGIAAVTIPVAIVAKKLSDPQAWIAVVFFTAIGAASWIAGRAASI